MEELRKKIIFTVTNDLSYDQRMIRICTTLANEGFDVELIGRRKKNSTPLPDKTYKQTRLFCWFSKGKLFYIEYNLRLFFFLLFKHADIYSATDLDTIVPNVLVSKIKSKKIVFDAHEYFTEVPEVTHRKTVKKIWEIIGKWFVPQADLCYTVSQSLADIFSVKYNKPFYLIRNVPYASTHHVSSGIQHPPVIFYQGDLNEGRGLEQAILAMKNLDAELHIAGDGLLFGKLKLMIEENNLKQKVYMLGYVHPDDLSKITAKATIGLNVLEAKGLSYYYSLSNKFFNYIQAGIPQLCANFPEYQHINSQYEVALLVDLHEDNLAAAMQRLLSDRELYLKLKNNCVLAAEQFNWQQEEPLLISLYRAL